MSRGGKSTTLQPQCKCKAKVKLHILFLYDLSVSADDPRPQGSLSVYTVKGHYYTLTCRLHLPANTLSSHWVPLQSGPGFLYLVTHTCLLFSLCLVS